MRALIRLSLVAYVGLLAGCAAPAEQAADSTQCRLERVAVMPLRYVGRALLVTGHIDGSAVQMQVDTGATALMIDEDAATRLALPSDPHRRTNLRGTGGTILTRNTLIDSFEMGGQEWQALSLATGHLAKHFNEMPVVAGLLGADRLADFDVEIDVPAGRMVLWTVTHCTGDFLACAQPHYVLPLARHWPNRMVAHLRLDGQPVAALVDSGADQTLVTPAAAGRVGVTQAMLQADRSGTTHGVDRLEKPVVAHRFEDLRIGREMIHHPGLLVADMNLNEVDMLLGADFLRRRHVWLSYATRQMFVMPSGPPVARDAAIPARSRVSGSTQP
jgi:predicted aspartyl protease